MDLSSWRSGLPGDRAWEQIRKQAQQIRLPDESEVQSINRLLAIEPSLYESYLREQQQGV